MGQKGWPANRFQQKRLCRCKPATVSQQLTGNRDFLIAVGTGVCTVVGDWAGLVESRPFITMKTLPLRGLQTGDLSNGTGKLLCRDHEIGRFGGGTSRGGGSVKLRTGRAEADALGVCDDDDRLYVPQRY